MTNIAQMGYAHEAPTDLPSLEERGNRLGEMHEMLKSFLGAASGSGLYLFSSDSGGDRIAFYFAGMALLALAAMWTTQATVRAARAYLRTATYLMRSKAVARETRPAKGATWVPLVETTRTISLGQSSEDNPARHAISA